MLLTRGRTAGNLVMAQGQSWDTHKRQLHTAGMHHRQGTSALGNHLDCSKLCWPKCTDAKWKVGLAVLGLVELEDLAVLVRHRLGRTESKYTLSPEDTLASQQHRRRRSCRHWDTWHE